METPRLDDRTYELLFGIRRSVRYHNHRRRFYETWNSITVTVSVVGGSGAAVAFFGSSPSWVAAAAAMVVALVGAIDLAVSTGRSGNHHAELARRFIGLERRFAHGRDLSDDEYEELTGKRLDIEATEPPALRLLDVICHYEVLKSLGDQSEPPSIPWWRRSLANWCSQLGYIQVMG